MRLVWKVFFDTSAVAMDFQYFEYHGVVVVVVRGFDELGAHDKQFFEPAAAGNDAGTGFYQAQIGVHMGHDASAGDGEFVAAARGHAVHRCNHRLFGEFQPPADLTEGCYAVSDAVSILGLQGFGELLEVGTGEEVCSLVEQDKTPVVRSGFQQVERINDVGFQGVGAAAARRAKLRSQNIPTPSARHPSACPGQA